MEKLTKSKNLKKILDKNGHKKKIHLLLNDDLFIDNNNFLLRLLKKSQNVPDKYKLMKRIRTSVNRNNKYDDENTVGFNKGKVELTYELDDLLYAHSKSFSKSKKRYYRIKKENDDFLSFYKYSKNPKIITSNFKKRFNSDSSKTKINHDIQDEELNNFDVLDNDNFLLMKEQKEVYYHYLFQTLNERKAYTQQNPYKYVIKIKKYMRKNSFNSNDSEKKKNNIYKEYNKTETNLSYKKEKIKYASNNKIKKFKNISHQNSKDNCKIHSKNNIEVNMKKPININKIKGNNKNNSNNTITYFRQKNNDENNFLFEKTYKKMDNFKRNANKKEYNNNANVHDYIVDEKNNNIDDNYKSEGEINKARSKTEIYLSSSKTNNKIIKINKENIILNANNNRPINIKNIESIKSHINKPEVNRNIIYTKTSQNKKSIISKLKNKYNFSTKNNFYQNKISSSNIDEQNFDKNKNETIKENNYTNNTNTNNSINTYYPNISDVNINKKSTNFTYKNKIGKILIKEGDKNKEKEINEMNDDYFQNNINKKRSSAEGYRRTLFDLYEEQKNKINSYNKNNFTNFKTGRKCFDQLTFNNNKDLFNRKEKRTISSFLTDTNNIDFTKIKDINISNYNNTKTLNAFMKNIKLKNKDKRLYQFLKNHFYHSKKLQKIEEVNNNLKNLDKCFIKKYSDFQVLISNEDDK